MSAHSVVYAVGFLTCALIALLLAWLVLACMWWLADAPCERCGRRHWSLDTRLRCKDRWAS